MLIGIISSPEASLFTYGTSGSWRKFYKPYYMPLFEARFSNPELEKEAQKVSKTHTIPINKKFCGKKLK